MGLLDISTGDNLGDLGLIGGLLTMRAGQGGPAPLLFQAAAMKQLQQKQERENRANDLQQLSGTYNLLKQQEFGRMMQAQQSGQPYAPNPQLAQIEARMTQLLGSSNLSSGQPPLGAPQQAPAMPPRPQAVPQQAPMQGPQMSPQAPQQSQQAPQQSPGLNIGGPAAGIPAQVWLAQDPTGKTYLEQLAKDRAPQNVRPGGTLATMGPDGKFGAAFFAPQVGPGMQPQRGPDGQVASASLIPGFLQGLAAVKSAESGASAAGALPFQKPEPYNTPGAPTLFTPRQAITAATGQDPLSVSPQEQTTRNATQLAILQRERQNATPQEAQALDTQIQALTRAQATGNPFAYSSNRGLTLQDNTAQEAQKTLGEGIGKEASNVFTTGAASVQAKKMLSGMSDMAKSYDPGKFQPLQSQLAQYAAPIFGEDAANRIFNTNAGDIQGLTSAAIAMAGKLTRQTDAQPSQLQFMKTLESMPMADRTPQGFARIMDYLNSVHDYNIEKMIALQQYLGKNNGDPSGFEAEWGAKSKNMPFVWNSPPKGTAQSQDPNSVNVNGKMYRFPSAQAAAAFKKQAGIQ